MLGMGRRREPRKEIQLAVRLFGTDSSGKMFSENALTVNVGQSGAELSGVRPDLNLDEVVGLSYGANRGRFKVRWIGKPGTPKAGHVGLLNIAPEKAFWDFPLPAPAKDDYQPAAATVGGVFAGDLSTLPCLCIPSTYQCPRRAG